MVTSQAHLLRALSLLLSYPDASTYPALPEIDELLSTTRGLAAPVREDLRALVAELRTIDPLDAEARFVELFDRGRTTSLNLFEHVHGEGRDRGPAMLDLRQKYLDAGLEPLGNELPDHLPVLLEYLSCCDAAEAREILADCAHILRAIGNRLIQRHSRYAAVFRALLDVAGAKGLDPHAPVPPPENLEVTWEERPAFANDKAPPCRPSDFRH